MSEITRLLIPRAAYQNMVTMLPAESATLAQVLSSSAGVEGWATAVLVGSPVVLADSPVPAACSWVARRVRAHRARFWDIGLDVGVGEVLLFRRACGKHRRCVVAGAVDRLAKGGAVQGRVPVGADVAPHSAATQADSTQTQPNSVARASRDCDAAVDTEVACTPVEASGGQSAQTAGAVGDVSGMVCTPQDAPSSKSCPEAVVGLAHSAMVIGVACHELCLQQEVCAVVALLDVAHMVFRMYAMPLVVGMWLVDVGWLQWSCAHILDLLVVAGHAFSGASNGKVVAICIFFLRASTGFRLCV